MDPWPDARTTLLPISHQGAGSHQHPPCSWEAFGTAHDLGYRHFETDLRSTSDGALVAIHDVDNRVGGSPISSLTRAQLEARLERRVPEMDELLAHFATGCFNFEVKDRADATAIVARLREHPAQRRVCVSWGMQVRVSAHRRAPGMHDVPTAATIAERAGRWVMAMGSMGRWTHRTPYRYGQFHHRVVTPWLVASVNRSGVGVHAWGVSARADLDRLVRLRVNGIISADAEHLKSVLQEHGAWPASG